MTRTTTATRNGKAAGEGQREKLRSAVAAWHQKVQTTAETVYRAATAILAKLQADPDGPLAEFLDPAAFGELVAGLERTSTALADMIPPADLDLPDVLALAK